MLRHRARDVGVVVLDRDLRRLRARLRVRGRDVVGVEVAGDHLGVYAEEALEAPDLLFVRVAGLEVVEVADVGSEPRLVPRNEAEGVLELGAAREHGTPHRADERHRPGHEPACATQHGRAAGDHPRHGVVAAVLDLAVVGQKEIGDAGQALAGLVVPGRHRLLGQVAGGHDEGSAGLREEQVVERGVGEDQADEGVAGGDGGSEAASLPSPHEHDRALHGEEKPPLVFVERGETLGRGEVFDHDRERLLVPPLALAQPRDGRVVGGVAGEMEAAETLDGHDRALPQARGRRHDRRVRGPAGSGLHRAFGILEKDAGPAIGTGVGLSMEAAVGHVLVLGGAPSAHRKRDHGRAGPVVGHVPGDREAGPAVRTVGERVAVAAIVGIEDLAQAVRARGEVGRNRDAPLRSLDAGLDEKELGRLDRNRLRPDVPHDGCGGDALSEAVQERVEHRSRPECFDRDSPAVVADASGEAFVAGQAIDEGSKAHPLHRPPHDDAPSLEFSTRRYPAHDLARKHEC
jgi:hypothetical protein